MNDYFDIKMTKLIYLKIKATQKFTQAKIFLDFHTLTDGKHPKKIFKL